MKSNYNKAMLKMLREKMDKHLSICVECKKKGRVKVDYDKLPKDFKKGIPEMKKASDKEIDYFLYCPNCKVYSTVFESEFM